MTTATQYSQRRRARRQALGLCIDCPKSVDGTLRCPDCSKRSSAAARARQERKMRRTVRMPLCPACKAETRDQVCPFCGTVPRRASLDAVDELSEVGLG